MQFKQVPRLATLILTTSLSCLASAQTTVGLTSGLIEAGQTASVAVSLSNLDPGSAGVNAVVSAPLEVQFADASAATPLTSFSFDVFEMPGSNEVGLLLYSPTETFGATSLNAVTLNFTVPPDTPPGDYPITFKPNSTGLSNQDGSISFPHTTTAGVITVVAPASLPLHLWKGLLAAMVLLPIALFARRYFARMRPSP